MNNPCGDNVDKKVGKVWICNRTVTIRGRFDRTVTIQTLSEVRELWKENAAFSWGDLYQGACDKDPEENVAFPRGILPFMEYPMKEREPAKKWKKSGRLSKPPRFPSLCYTDNH